MKTRERNINQERNLDTSIMDNAIDESPETVTNIYQMKKKSVKVYFTRPVFTELLLYFYLINNENFYFALVYFYFNLLWGI